MPYDLGGNSPLVDVVGSESLIDYCLASAHEMLSCDRRTRRRPARLTMSGPLADVIASELAGIGPGLFAAMLLADMGAQV